MSEGSKIIYNLTKCDYQPNPVAHFTTGYLMSPFENRIAIIDTYKWYVGELRTLNKFNIIGAHLETGFTQ